MERCQPVVINQIEGDLLLGEFVCQGFCVAVVLEVRKEDVKGVRPIGVEDVSVYFLYVQEVESLAKLVLEYAEVERAAVFGTRQVKVYCLAQNQHVN